MHSHGGPFTQPRRGNPYGWAALPAAVHAVVVITSCHLCVASSQGARKDTSPHLQWKLRTSCPAPLRLVFYCWPFIFYPCKPKEHLIYNLITNSSQRLAYARTALVALFLHWTFWCQVLQSVGAARRVYFRVIATKHNHSVKGNKNGKDTAYPLSSPQGGLFHRDRPCLNISYRRARKRRLQWDNVSGFKSRAWRW